MADFRPLLLRAIAGLPENTPEARQIIYTRARDALERHLGSREPALEEAERRREILALEDVISILEAEAQQATAPARKLELDQEPLSPEKPLSSEKSATALQPAPAIAPDTVIPVLAGKPPTPEQPAAADGKTEAKPETDIGIFADSAPEAPIALKVPERLKLPEPETDAPKRKRLGLLAGFGILAILGMGALALTYRAGPDHYRKAKIPASTERPAGEVNDQNKREGRLNAPEATPAPRPPTPAPQQPTLPAPSPGAPPAPSQPPLLVASRAFMILEGQGAAPDQFEGQANWSFMADAANPSGPKTVRLDVQFAAAGLKLDGSISLNADRAIDASHTILLVFDPGEKLAAIREMSAIEWRERETVNGATLSGRLAPIQDNVFMIGLDANATALQRNLDLLRSQKWLVFETRMANGRRGAFLIEKGSSGEKAISEALSVWK